MESFMQLTFFHIWEIFYKCDDQFQADGFTFLQKIPFL